MLFVASITNVLIVPPDFPAKSVAELIALAKKEPGKLVRLVGRGQLDAHVGGAFKSLSGTDILHIPWRGAARRFPT